MEVISANESPKDDLNLTQYTIQSQKTQILRHYVKKYREIHYNIG